MILADLSLIVVFVTVIFVVDGSASYETGAARRRSSDEWKLIFYTGDKLWAGTDSELFVELLGKNGNSEIIPLKPRKHQLEADAIDVFSLGDLRGRDVGELKSIIIAKQHSYSFFNDWELIKVEVQMNNKKKETMTKFIFMTRVP